MINKQNLETPDRITVRELAKMIDHSLLHPTMTDSVIEEGLELSKKYAVATACVKPCSVSHANVVLRGSDVKVCAVIGFPHGNNTPAIKVAEAVQAIHDGATEIDMVANAGKVLGEDWAAVKAELNAVNKACVDNGAILKVIFENDYLQNAHIIHLCELCTELDIAFAKTSSGYGFVKQPDGNYNYKGATMEHLILMRKHCGPAVQIKAAGGVRTLDDLLKVREVGVTRIGATATKVILDEAISRGFLLK